MNPALKGGIAVAAGSALFGLFWIPLRYLEAQGIAGLWAVTLVMFATGIPSLLILLRRKSLSVLKNRDVWLIGGAMGLSSVLYFLGVIYSDIIRVIFLFYLLPVWTTLAAYFLYNEHVHKIQLLIIAAALFGVWLLLGGGTDVPLPKNAGDWCGLAAGITWGLSLAMLRGKEVGNATATVTAVATSGGVFGLIALVTLAATQSGNTMAMVNWSTWYWTIPLILCFGTLFLFPTYFGQVWGAEKIPAPTAALLTMSEIVVATVSAWLLIGTELNRISLLGAVIIVCAAVADIAYKYRLSKSGQTTQ